MGHFFRLSFRLYILFLFVFLSLFFSSKVTLASTIRIGGFDSPRNDFPFNDEDSIVSNLEDPSKFGIGGVVSCGVEFKPFVQEIAPGSLVSNGVRTLDVFIAGSVGYEYPEYRALSTAEAVELALFVEKGGIVYISDTNYVDESPSVNTFFEALGVVDRFSPDVDYLSFLGESYQPIETRVTKGPFGLVGNLTHGDFRVFSVSSFTPVAKGFETIGGIITMALGESEADFGENYVLHEMAYGDGYISVSGMPLYIPFLGSGADEDNVKYFLNLVSLACKAPSSVFVPFLDLPWDYQGKGMTFSQAALSINSYFDHEYPLLSIGMSEPISAQGSATIYKGLFRTSLDYSSHDGYDYGKSAQTKEGTPVLAAASGCAYYKDPKYQCGDKTCARAYGNAVLINHDGAGEGFQTRYYHLQDGSMITTNTDPAQCVQVTKGQQIGKVGHTGNVSPTGEAGSHIHFMVI